MIRILVIDDAETPEFLDDMCRGIEGGYHVPVRTEHINPTKFLSGEGADQEIAALLSEVQRRANDCWDVVIVDIRLREIDRPEDELLEVSLSIAERFRAENRAAIVLLYSGNLSKSIPKLIERDASSKKSGSEKVLKRVFLAGISGFVERDQIGNEVYSVLEDPPWLLCVDRLLTRNAKLKVNVEESEFKERSFEDLATAVRRQNPFGRRVAKLIAEFGVASLVDLNK
jgi:CheY-like chemotaxis protein